MGAIGSPCATSPTSPAWTRIDLLDRDKVRREVRNDPTFGAVYHCAGASHLGASWKDTAQPLANNALATHYLLDALRRAGGEVRVVVTGSATGYAPSTAPLREDDLLAPNSPYAISKLAQEQLALRESAEDGVSVMGRASVQPHWDHGSVLTLRRRACVRQIALIEHGSPSNQ